MKFQLLTATALLALCTAAFADGRFERTLTTSAQPDLYVANGAGNISVHPSESTSIHIVGHIHNDWTFFGVSADSAGAIKDIENNPPITQDGNSVHVGFSSRQNTHVSIDYDIAVPAATALNLHSGSGDIKVAQVGRFLAAGTGSGNITADGSSGSSDLQSGSGDIKIELATGGDVKARTGSGNINIQGFNGNLMAHSGSGDITAAGKLTGPANLSSGSGNITLHLTPEARFDIEASTGSGNLRVRFPGAPQQDDHNRHHLTGPVNGGGPPLQVRTGSGNVEITS